MLLFNVKTIRFLSHSPKNEKNIDYSKHTANMKTRSSLFFIEQSIYILIIFTLICDRNNH